MSGFHGTYTVTITPFDAAGAVNLPALRDFIDWQITQGIHGVIPLGSTGEFLSLSDEERHAVAATVVETAARRVPVLIGTGAERTEDAIRYSREAEAMGADGVMIIPPFYSTPTEEELFAHFRRIGDAIGIPIMVYNNPATANVDLTPQILARLSEIDAVAYVKESTLEVTRIRDIIELCGDRLIPFGGILGFESFVEGAAGWVAVGSNVMPAAFADLYRLTVEQGDIPAARALYRRLLPIIRMVAEHRYVSGSKAALAMMGRDVGLPRSPRLPAPPDERAKIETILHSLGLIGA